jgi:hypothetical protein
LWFSQTFQTNATTKKELRENNRNIRVTRINSLADGAQITLVNKDFGP